MAEDVKQHKVWDVPPIPTHLVPHNDKNDSDEEEDVKVEDEKGGEFVKSVNQFS